ncbi:DinB family protein [Aeromicrobium sp.]|uniref:DinB family protein n=1 Tax=Aeromicrobium sp. TaxID=1871063 RepID=UPI003D6BAFB2
MTTWTAPYVDRRSGPLTGPERPQLESLLGWHRATLVSKCAGLTGEQLAARPLPTTTITLLGLIRHMAKVERTWFRIRLDGQDVASLFGERVDEDFDDIDPLRAAQEHDQLTAEWLAANAAASGHGLDDTFDHHGTEFSLRMVYLHMIAEYARHNGHADLLREHLDGVTGA